MMKHAPIRVLTTPLWAAAVLGAAVASPAGFAQDSGFHTQDSSSHVQDSSSRSSGGQESGQVQMPDRDLDARLADARRRLEEAAQQVAELSAELGADARNRAFIIRERFRRGVIGLQLDPASGPEGARVLDVSPGGPAAEAGVRAGDIVVALNGTPITGRDSARKLVERVRELQPNAKVTLSIKRGAKVEQVQLTTRPAYAFAFTAPFEGPGPAVIRPLPPVPAFPGMPDLQYLRVLSDETAGMELASISPALGWYFGTDKGVLVLRASENDAFGLKDGDVILSIDGREPRNGAHATRILSSYQPGERITLKIMRQKRPLSLNVTLPQPPEQRRPDRRRDRTAPPADELGPDESGTL
jgi:predicted metalloprotease with PDZ domain